MKRYWILVFAFVSIYVSADVIRADDSPSQDQPASSAQPESPQLTKLRTKLASLQAREADLSMQYQKQTQAIAYEADGTESTTGLDASARTSNSLASMASQIAKLRQQIKKVQQKIQDLQD